MVPDGWRIPGGFSGRGFPRGFIPGRPGPKAKEVISRLRTPRSWIPAAPQFIRASQMVWALTIRCRTLLTTCKSQVEVLVLPEKRLPAAPALALVAADSNVETGTESTSLSVQTFIQTQTTLY